MPDENIKTYKKNKKSSFPIIPFLLLILIGAGLSYIYLKPPVFRKPEINRENEQYEIFSGTSYEAIDKSKFEVSLFASNIRSISSIVISKDERYMLASTLEGDVIGFIKQGNDFIRQPDPIFSLHNIAPGLPEEFGLTGVAFSADFETSKEIFIFYSKKTSEDKLFNHVGKFRLEEQNGILSSSSFSDIFTANVEGNVSHQIQRGISLMIGDKTHVLFAIGEGFNPSQALDKKVQSGKILLIQADGSDPLGPRPFSEDKKLQAIGIRNAPVINHDKFDPNNRFIITDTGPEKFDRFIYLNLLNQASTSIKEISLNWDGSEASLQKALPDPNLNGISDMVLNRWNPTVTVTNAEVHSGKGAIPLSNENSTSILLVTFGLTGEKGVTRGKEVLLGKLDRTNTQPTLTTEPIIKRSSEASNFAGNPLGLVIEKSGDFYFGDIIEGKIYQVKIK